MDRFLLASAALFGLVGVVTGAFGAHALRAKVPPERLASFETGARYLLLHAPAIVAVVWMRTAGPDAASETVAGLGFVAGGAVFAGSLFALALTGRRRWGAVTPIGGVLLLAGWAALLVAALTAPIRFSVF
jgi:uncharacterized membrane protein YgdD (TMEM256/DUF423 family)